jgi:hypothetical protein
MDSPEAIRVKLRWMGTQRGQIIGVLPWLVRWTCRAGTIDFVLPWLLYSQPSTKYYFHFFSLHRSATWADRRAGSPVSVSLEGTIRAPFSLGEWSGQGLRLGGKGGSSGSHLPRREQVFMVGASFFQGLQQRGSLWPHFHGGPYMAIILRSFRLKSLQVPHFRGGSFVRVSFFGAFYWWIVRAQLLRRLWTGSPFQEHYRALVSEGGREASQRSLSKGFLPLYLCFRFGKFCYSEGGRGGSFHDYKLEALSGYM